MTDLPWHEDERRPLVKHGAALSFVCSLHSSPTSEASTTGGSILVAASWWSHECGGNLADAANNGLRRACGSHWLACGVALFNVSKWLGHADVSTTAKHYAGLADSLSQSEMAKVNAMQVA